MSDYDDYDLGEEPEEPGKPRDSKVDQAKIALMEGYFSKGKTVYYGRQLEIALETDFFHWITKKALNELVQERKIGFTAEAMESFTAHFYYPRGHRYARRQINETIGLIQEFSDPRFTRALGHHGEMLVESAVARTGFRIVQQKVKSVDGKRWVKSGHDLDYLIERDGLRFGVEVKNTLGYIGQTEFQTKMQMCEFFGVRPLFVCRKLPKTYMWDIYQAGGHATITDNQNYPLLADELAKRVKQTLKLPVAVIQRLPDTALKRLEKRIAEGSLVVRGDPDDLDFS